MEVPRCGGPLHHQYTAPSDTSHRLAWYLEVVRRHFHRPQSQPRDQWQERLRYARSQVVAESGVSSGGQSHAGVYCCEHLRNARPACASALQSPGVIPESGACLMFVGVHMVQEECLGRCADLAALERRRQWTRHHLPGHVSAGVVLTLNCAEQEGVSPV